MPLTKKPATGTTTGYVEFLPDGYDKNKKYPTVLFFHGIGERGDGSQGGLENLYQFINSQWYPFAAQLKNRGIILIAVQLPWDKTYWPLSYVDDALAISQKYAVDESQLYISGVSLGGGAVWGYTAANAENGKKFAAILACCCVGASGIWTNIKSPVRAYHAQNDGIVGFGNSKAIIDAINAGNPPEKAEVRDKVGNMALKNHEIWGVVYGENEAWDWLLSKKKTDSVEPVPPETEKVLEYTIKYFTDGTFEKIDA